MGPSGNTRSWKNPRNATTMELSWLRRPELSWLRRPDYPSLPHWCSWKRWFTFTVWGLAATTVSNSRRYWKDHLFTDKFQWWMVSRRSLSAAVPPKPWFHYPSWWDFLEYISKEALFFTQCWYFCVPMLSDLLSKEKRELNDLKL